MAILRNFKCKQCGYQLLASSMPYVVTMAGLYAQCYCKNCQEVVNVSAGENYQVDVTVLSLKCEKCFSPVSVWTPDMGCPKCGGTMKMNQETF